MIHIRKTYQGLNPEMLYEELRDLAGKQGLLAEEAGLQTYPLSSGATQTRAVMKLKTSKAEGEKECGSAHIIGSPSGETKMILDMDENLFPADRLKTMQENLDFILGSYEERR